MRTILEVNKKVGVDLHVYVRIIIIVYNVSTRSRLATHMHKI